MGETSRKKKGVKHSLLLPHGIAKHQYPYNSEAHTSEGVSIRFPLLMDPLKLAISEVPQAEANTSFMSLCLSCQLF